MAELVADVGMTELRLSQDPHFGPERVFAGFALKPLLEHVGLGDAEVFDAYFDQPNIEEGHADFASGVIHETALLAGVDKLRPYLFSPQKIQQGLADMRQMMLENGVTTSADLAFGAFGGLATEAPLFKSLYDRADTPSRILAIPVAPAIEIDPNQWLADTRAQYASDKFTFSNRVKLFADGAFFAQFMQMKICLYHQPHKVLIMYVRYLCNMKRWALGCVFQQLIH